MIFGLLFFSFTPTPNLICGSVWSILYLGSRRSPGYYYTREPGAAFLLIHCKLVSRDQLPRDQLHSHMIQLCHPLSLFGRTCEQQLLKWFWWNVTFAGCGHQPKNLSLSIVNICQSQSPNSSHGAMIEFIKCFYSSRIKRESFTNTSVFHPTHVPSLFLELRKPGHNWVEADLAKWCFFSGL